MAEDKSVAVVGGGAAGYFAAIRIREVFPDYKVVLLEGGHRPLSKVRISGGGRCNVTHACFDPAQLVASYPRGHKELRGPFSKFQPRDTMQWFEERGVKLKTEDDGRIFPVSDNSQTIIDCLQNAAKEAEVEVRLGAILKTVTREENVFVLHFKGDVIDKFNKLLLATGSSPSGYAIAKSLGHTIAEPLPSLFTFNVQDPRLADLPGISFPEVDLTLQAENKNFHQRGPLLITHWGLSGPAVLKLSAWAAPELFHSDYQANLKINFLPKEKADSVKAHLDARRQREAKRNVFQDNVFSEAMAKRYWQRSVEVSGISPTLSWANVNNEQLKNLAEQITAASFRICGKGVFKEEFVTCGGVSLKEVDFRTMESKVCPGLFFAGEILDIDGITGGFNFQNAWTTAWISGSSIS